MFWLALSALVVVQKDWKIVLDRYLRRTESPGEAMATEEFSRNFSEKEGVERNFGELRAKK